MRFDNAVSGQCNVSTCTAWTAEDSCNTEEEIEEEEEEEEETWELFAVLVAVGLCLAGGLVYWAYRHEQVVAAPWLSLQKPMLLRCPS